MKEWCEWKKKEEKDKTNKENEANIKIRIIGEKVAVNERIDLKK